MPSVRLGPIIGLIIQAALLTALDRAAGLGPAGWAAGVAYLLTMAILLTRALHAAAIARFGPADWVTLTRASLVCVVTALTVESLTAPVPVALVVSITTVALVLDAVDGQVARRTGTATAFGARFDMEVDAFLILVLSVYIAPLVGGWVLAIGAMRYVYVAASWALPWMHRQLPPRYWRKVVAAVQGITLTVVAAQVLPWWLGALGVAVALALLSESFGRDLVWLWQRRDAAPAPSADAAGVDVAGTAERAEAFQ